MKKSVRIISLFAVICIICGLLCACKDEQYEAYDRTGQPYDYYLPDYVKVCEYIGIEIPDITYTPSAKDIDNEMKIRAGYYCERTQDPDRPCQNYDYVDIVTKCTLKETGEIYSLFHFEENESGYGQTFMLGTNNFGFPALEEAVLGMEAGETKKVTLTLPDPYYYDYLNSGKELEIEIRLTYIDEVDFSNVDDNFYLEHYGYDREGMRHIINEELRTKLNEKIANYKVALTWNYICENSKLKKVPEKEYNDLYDSYLNQARNAAESKKMTLLEYVNDTLGYEDLDSYYDYLKYRAENECYEDMLLYYILRYENLTYTDEFYDQCVLKMAEPYDIKDATEAEEFLLYYMGNDGLHESVLMQYVQDWIAQQAIVREDVHQIYSDKLN